MGEYCRKSLNSGYSFNKSLARCLCAHTVTTFLLGHLFIFKIKMLANSLLLNFCSCPLIYKSTAQWSVGSHFAKRIGCAHLEIRQTSLIKSCSPLVLHVDKCFLRLQQPEHMLAAAWVHAMAWHVSTLFICSPAHSLFNFLTRTQQSSSRGSKAFS